ncbi:GntP family permease [Serpentinicella alkaliphila]|uniref:H+/gluconate symporter-like permease n=1 Tax=Serpentinicella alkaliphila TaxID=1734049 RepID=A0A4R2U1Q6_9FIRM|nr:GntP family permease [Serpentinicella alkaliphila]QUH25377.1 GntP family permease [Serpentinicella alkaliphila]TCQ01553.1 H+/gluconate symporter-like permease [Serpentinicella alkaliphila]
MFGIIIGLALLMFLAYKGMSIIWVAPICAAIVALTGGLELLPSYTDTYMTGFVNFTKSWFPVFMLGAIFGKVMDESGAARSVAFWITKLIGTKFAIAAVVAACGILTYGGVSLFVVVFAIYPLAVALFREANISRKLIPGTIALGSFTFTMTALPGTPQIQNLIPMQYFGTTPTAAPIIGVVGAIVMAGGGLLWMNYSQKKLTAAGERFVELDKKIEEVNEASLPNPLLSALPLLTVIILLNLFKFNIITSLIAGTLVGIALGFNRLPKLIETINAGAAGSVLAIINTSAAVGFGAVVRAVPGFQGLVNFVLSIEGNPLISEAIAVNILAGATGSASGGMGIALEALGAQYVELAAQTGVPLEAFHRIASMSSGGLDTLPHNGAVLTLLAVCAMTHKDSYKDIFMVGCFIPIIAVVVGIILASIGLI